MAPFIQEDNVKIKPHEEEFRSLKMDLDMLSPDKIMSDKFMSEDETIFEDEDSSILSNFLRVRDKRLIYGGIAASVICLSGTLIYFLTRSQPTELEELPVIKADITPMKEKVNTLNSEAKKDKKIYTYITAEDEDMANSKLTKNDHIISINELEKSKLTEDDKKMILRAFEELAPNAKRRQVKPKPKIEDSYEEFADEPEPIKVKKSPPIVKKVEQPLKQPKLRQSWQARQKIDSKVDVQKLINQPISRKKSEGLANLINQHNPQKKTVKEYLQSQKVIFVQVASLPTKNAANQEYNRLLRGHRSLSNFGYKIVPVQVGKTTKYRIMVGPFKSKDEASNAVRKMRNDGLNPLW